MNQDVQWLAEYARTGSAESFARLVKAHVALVYSAAIRQLRDHHLAEDVTQQVFMALAKKARSIRRETVPASWLLVTTRYLARDARRSARRRARREERAAQMRPTTTESPENDPWPAIEPLLDDALCSLSAADRRAITLRYLEGRNVEQVAAALDVSRHAAAQRLHRAIERLRDYFKRRGASVDRAALGSLILSHAVRPPPPELAVSIVKSAAALHAGAGLLTKGATMAAISSKVKVLTTAAVIALSVGGTATVVYNVAKPKTRTVALRPSASISITPGAPRIGQWWRPRLNQVYGLQSGEVIKHVPGPYIPERNAYFSDVLKDQPSMVESAISPSSSTLFVFEQEPDWRMQQYGGPYTFLGIAHAMTGLRSYDFDGLGDIGSMRLPGDWVMRANVDPPQRLTALASIVSSEFGKPLKLAPKTVERDVIVAKGSIDIHSLPKEFNNCVALYIGERKGNGVGHSAGSMSDFLGDVGEMLDTKFINETAPPNKQLFWHQYVAKNLMASEAREELLKHISEQSGITFTKERRPVEVWFAQSGETAKNDTTAGK